MIPDGGLWLKAPKGSSISQTVWQGLSWPLAVQDGWGNKFTVSQAISKTSFEHLGTIWHKCNQSIVSVSDSISIPLFRPQTYSIWKKHYLYIYIYIYKHYTWPSYLYTHIRYCINFHCMSFRSFAARTWPCRLNAEICTLIFTEIDSICDMLNDGLLMVTINVNIW